jgi:hypothetical protein
LTVHVIVVPGLSLSALSDTTARHGTSSPAVPIESLSVTVIVLGGGGGVTGPDVVV